MAISFELSQARILIIDDQEANIELLRDILELSGYCQIVSTTNPRLAASLCHEFHPDLILLDLLMPGMDGYAVMENLAPLLQQHSYMPILVLSADITHQARQRALANGAKDFVVKPFNVAEVQLRIRNLLETRSLYLKLQRQRRQLEQHINDRTSDLQDAQIETLNRLARAAEYRDDETGQHTQRVGQIAALVAQELALPDEDVALLRLAAPLHDIGKIGIRDSILLKPGRLTLDEFMVMQSHTLIGSELLSGGRSQLLAVAEQIALAHHERWNGTGYPHGLAEEAIPLAGRIVSVVDVFDALTHARVYKPAWTAERALDELEQQAGRQFDPRVIAAFLGVVRRTSLILP